MGDHFSDYPQSVGSSTSDWKTTAQKARNNALSDLQIGKLSFRLWKWARDLTEEAGDPRPLPCKFSDNQREFIPALEVRVRELFPVAYPGQRDSDLEMIFSDLGLEPLVAQKGK